MAEIESTTWHGTTILSVRKGKEVVVACDSQVFTGDRTLKSNVSKVRRLGKTVDVIAGFTGSTADAAILFQLLETKHEQNPHQLVRSCVDLAKDWRGDDKLRGIHGMMIIVNSSHAMMITGSGDVLESENGLIGIGVGGPFALSAAKALLDIEALSAKDIAEKAMTIAAEICAYTNSNVVFEIIEIKG